MYVPYPTALFVLFITSSTAHVVSTHVPDTSRNPDTIVAGANHFADPEAGLLLGVLDKRQQDAVTGYAPDNSTPTTTFALGPTLYSTLTPGQTEISFFSASLSCQGHTCVGQADGQTTWTTSNPFAAATSSSAAISGSMSSATTRSEGTSNTIHPSTSTPSAAANGDCPRLSLSILLCTTAVFASVVGIAL